MQKFKDKFFGLPIPIQFAVIIASLVVIYGIIGPSMVSSNSTVAVWMGIFIVLSSTYILYQLSEKLLEKLLK